MIGSMYSMVQVHAETIYLKRAVKMITMWVGRGILLQLYSVVSNIRPYKNIMHDSKVHVYKSRTQWR